MSAETLQSWFGAARRRWPAVAWSLERFSIHAGGERPSHPEDLFLGGAASERLASAWSAIDLDFRAEVIRRVTRVGRSSIGAEDLWSEAIMRLMSEDPDGIPLPCGSRSGRIRRFRGSVPLPSYIAVVAKRIALDRMRRDAVAKEAGMGRARSLGPAGRSPAEAAATRELAEQFAKTFAGAFASLTPTRQALLSLIFGQGMGKAEAGRILGMRDYQVSRELKASTDMLRDRLEHLNPGAWSSEGARAWTLAWTSMNMAGEEPTDEHA